MPRMVAMAASRTNPDVTVLVTQNDDGWYRVLTNDTPDKDDNYDKLVDSSMEFTKMYELFCSMV